MALCRRGDVFYESFHLSHHKKRATVSSKKSRLRLFYRAKNFMEMNYFENVG